MVIEGIRVGRRCCCSRCCGSRRRSAENAVVAGCPPRVINEGRNRGQTALVDAPHVVIEVTPDGSKKLVLPPKFPAYTRRWAEKKKILGLPTNFSLKIPRRVAPSSTPHGIPTPILCRLVPRSPTVKGLMTDTVRDLGARVFWQIQYHLSLGRQAESGADGWPA